MSLPFAGSREICFKGFLRQGDLRTLGFRNFTCGILWIRISSVDAEIRFRLFIKLTKFVGTVIMDLGARNGDGI